MVQSKIWKYDLEVQKWGDGGWKKNLIKYGNKDPCNSMKFTLGPNFKHVMIQSNHSQDCPFVPVSKKILNMLKIVVKSAKAHNLKFNIFKMYFIWYYNGIEGLSTSISVFCLKTVKC